MLEVFTNCNSTNLAHCTLLIRSVFPANRLLRSKICSRSSTFGTTTYCNTLLLWVLRVIWDLRSTVCSRWGRTWLTSHADDVIRHAISGKLARHGSHAILTWMFQLVIPTSNAIGSLQLHTILVYWLCRETNNEVTSLHSKHLLSTESS